MTDSVADMNDSIQNQTDTGQQAGRDILAGILWCCVGYCAISCLTLPFIGSFWFGEFPVLAVFQLPKIVVAEWLRTHVVMKGITFMGLSSGSFSPDYLLARPYALAIVYLIPIILVAVFGLYRIRRAPSGRSFVTVMLAFLFASILDYLFTLTFADGRSLTIY